MKWFNFSSIDWILMIPVFVLLSVSLVTLLSIDPQIFKNQLLFVGISFIAFLLVTQINPSIFRYYSIPIYIASLILLSTVLVFGSESRGSVRWFEFLGFGIQFSELLKPFLALALASFLASLRDYSFKSFLSVLVFLFPLVILIFLQPDLGNALIYVFVTIGILIIFGFPYKWFFAGFLIWLATLPLFWLVLHDYQRQRVLTFINPGRDPLDTSYNAIQAVIAVGSGMILGKGLGQGTQAGLRFLPEQHTDFIFATISEELGFIGALVVIICFAVIFYRLY